MKWIKFKSVPLDSLIKIDRVCSTYFYCFNPNFMSGGEYHTSWELAICTLGEIATNADGKKIVLKKGQAYLHKPLQKHGHGANHKVSNIVNIIFESKSKKLYDLADKVLETTPTAEEHIGRIVEEGIPLLHGMNNMPKEDRAPTWASAEILKDNLELLLISYAQQLENQGANPDQDPAKFNHYTNLIVVTITNLISKNYAENLTLEDIASRVGFSIPYISKLFKAKMGCSIIAYEIRTKISKAKEMIGEGNYNFQEISEALNYESVQYFSKQFKKYMMMTPSEYRQSIKLNYAMDPEKIR